MKRVLFLLLIYLTIPCSAQAAALSENKAVFQLGSDKYILNDKEQVMDTIPFLSNGRALIPVRYLAHACGIEDSKISWDPVTQKVTLKIGRAHV